MTESIHVKVINYLNDPKRSDANLHWKNLANRGFFATRDEETATDILRSYLNRTDVCTEGRQRALKHFGLETKSQIVRLIIDLEVDSDSEYYTKPAVGSTDYIHGSPGFVLKEKVKKILNEHGFKYSDKKNTDNGWFVVNPTYKMS